MKFTAVNYATLLIPGSSFGETSELHADMFPALTLGVIPKVVKVIEDAHKESQVNRNRENRAGSTLYHPFGDAAARRAEQSAGAIGGHRDEAAI
jgi:hypothetical protein